MNLIQYKSVDNSVVDVDDKSRVVKNVLNKTNMVDSDNDLITNSAFDKTIQERGPAGSNLIYHLTDHTPSLKSAVGKFSQLYMDGDNLVGITKIPATTWGNDVLEMYKSGIINQHSIGFSTIKSDALNADAMSAQVIKEVKLYEGSAVLWGANDQTPNLSVGKSLKGMTMIEKQNHYQTIIKRLDAFTKMLKDGKISDETGELMELQMKQIQDELNKLFKSMTTPPVSEETVEPEEVKVEENSVEDIFKQILLRTKKISNL